MNLRAFEPTDKAIGSWTGIITQRARSGPGGPGAVPTTFKLSWHWNFILSSERKLNAAPGEEAENFCSVNLQVLRGA